MIDDETRRERSARLKAALLRLIEQLQIDEIEIRSGMREVRPEDGYRIIEPTGERTITFRGLPEPCGREAREIQA